MPARYHSIDFLKFVAALFITNSHFQPLYKDVSPSLATLGVHGNALFFFVSGFLLMMGLERRRQEFSLWYKKRMQRIWPSLLVWCVASSIVRGKSMTWQDVVLMREYWFLQCIAVYYILYFIVTQIIRKNPIGGGKIALAIAVVVTVVSFFAMPRTTLSIFHTDLHFVCHFSVMIMGGMVYLLRDGFRPTSLWRDAVCTLFWFSLYFVFLYVGKGRDDFRYNIQILGLLPLHLFILHLYKLCTHPWCARLLEAQGWRLAFSIVSSLTLEIYIVQHSIITDAFNSVFPLNTLIVFALICAAAYGLRVATSLFVQFLLPEPFNVKKALAL